MPLGLQQDILEMVIDTIPSATTRLVCIAPSLPCGQPYMYKYPQQDRSAIKGRAVFVEVWLLFCHLQECSQYFHNYEYSMYKWERKLSLASCAPLDGCSRWSCTTRPKKSSILQNSDTFQWSFIFQIPRSPLFGLHRGSVQPFENRVPKPSSMEIPINDHNLRRCLKD